MLAITPVSFDEKEILRNLLEKYDYEFSQYDDRDVNPLGLYGYEYFDHYWTEEDRRWAFFIKTEDKLAGFVMVKKTTREDYSIAEFFIMYKYRRTGLGKQALFTVLDMFKGKWEILCHPKNPAVNFWFKSVNDFTKGSFSQEETILNDGNSWHVFRFSNSE